MSHQPKPIPWLELAVAQSHPLLKTWYNPAQLEDNLRENVERDLDWLQSLGEKFSEQIPVTGATPAMYNHRILEIAGMQVMLGIRFKAMNPDFPFVDVVRSTQPIVDGAQVKAIKNAIRQEFVLFKPKAARFCQPSHLEYQFPNGSGDKRFLAAPLTLMLERPEPASVSRLTLKRCQNLDFYPRYAAIYDELYLERPWLPEVARVEPLEDMEANLEQGTTFEVFLDGDWAGVISLDRSREHGLSGWYTNEIVLEKHARGRGVGAILQRVIAQTLLEHPQTTASDLLWGTIGAINMPMLKTATRAGRLDVGGWYWDTLLP
jgi:GNAT superfamily N-acetyltransferase